MAPATYSSGSGATSANFDRRAWTGSRLVDFASSPSPFVGRARVGRSRLDARWLAPLDLLADRVTPRVGLVGEQVAYVIAPAIERDDLQATGSTASSVLPARACRPSCDGAARGCSTSWTAELHALCEIGRPFSASLPCKPSCPPT